MSKQPERKKILGAKNPEAYLHSLLSSGVWTKAVVFRKLQSSNDLTVIIISHDLNTIHDVADLVLCLNRKQICFGRPHEVLDHRILHHLYGEEIEHHHPDGHNLSEL